MIQNKHGFLPDIRVIVRILKLLCFPVTREFIWTHLQNASGLNHGVFKRYIIYLHLEKIIIITNDKDNHRMIRITSMGIQALEDLLKWKFLRASYN
jgi:predicted transcriptional regulator